MYHDVVCLTVANYSLIIDHEYFWPLDSDSPSLPVLPVKVTVFRSDPSGYWLVPVFIHDPARIRWVLRFPHMALYL